MPVYQSWRESTAATLAVGGRFNILDNLNMSSEALEIYSKDDFKYSKGNVYTKMLLIEAKSINISKSLKLDRIDLSAHKDIIFENINKK